ncbi:hypothetical protein KAF25_010821 [Fusarium avenaceum]|uniref:Uncharacterized protein n=1 Tax=Fusarium avenaceum TaxID=40199 RepID=A0A9P7H068_9HYPO|nr:hypothetical protein KAF25_010821 [Fusarium avenaceum]
MAPPLQNQQDNESVSSVDSFDPDPTVVQKTITRQEAIDQAEDFIHKISSLDFDQDALKRRMNEWTSEPVLRVLPPDLKASVRLWCWHYSPEWFYKLSKFLDEDLSEWNYTVEIPNRRKYMALCGLGADILRFYVADLKPLRKGLPEPERRELVNNARRGLSIFADYHEEKIRQYEEKVRHHEERIRRMEIETQAQLQHERDSINAECNAFLAASELQSQAMLD